MVHFPLKFKDESMKAQIGLVKKMIWFLKFRLPDPLIIIQQITIGIKCLKNKNYEYFLIYILLNF